MADTVQYILEQMVPELEDLRRKEIFSKDEIRSIVKRRTDFEYSLKRRKPEKTAFLRCIQYELALEQLRKKRKSRLGITKQNSPSDHAILRRIHFIFSRALRKYGGDLRLWLQYVDFCKQSGANKTLGRTFAQMLQLHPTKVALWALAASHEADVNQNMRSARVLFQRGLRLNGTAAELWLAYCNAELQYMQKLIDRRRVLGVAADEVEVEAAAAPERDVSDSDRDAADADDTDDEEGSGDEFTRVGRKRAAEKAGKPKKKKRKQLTDAEKAAKAGAILSAAIPRAIYRNAIAAIPSDIDFRDGFLLMYRRFDNTTAAQDDVYASLQRDFEDMPRVTVLCARRPFDTVAEARLPETRTADAVREGATAADKALARATKKSTSWVLWAGYVEFVDAALETAVSSGWTELASERAARCAAVYRACHAAGCSTPALYAAWVRVLVRTSASTADILEIGRLATTAHPTVPETWLLRAQVADRASAALGISEPDTDVHALLLQATTRVEGGEALGRVWAALLDHCVTTGHADTEALFQRAVHSGASGAPLDCMYVAWAAATGGVRKARSVYERLLKRLAPSRELFAACVRAENAVEEPDTEALVRLYEAALTSYGRSDSDLWLDYLGVLRRAGQFERSGAVYWRAVKSLDAPQLFIEKYGLVVQ